MRLNHERSFFENRRNCSPSELHGGGLFRTILSITKAGYVNAVPAFVCFELPAREASSICDFLKIDLLRFHRIYLLFD